MDEAASLLMYLTKQHEANSSTIRIAEALEGIHTILLRMEKRPMPIGAVAITPMGPSVNTG